MVKKSHGRQLPPVVSHGVYIAFDVPAWSIKPAPTQEHRYGTLVTQPHRVESHLMEATVLDITRAQQIGWGLYL
jgi:hypothetical protein